MGRGMLSARLKFVKVLGIIGTRSATVYKHNIYYIMYVYLWQTDISFSLISFVLFDFLSTDYF